MTLKTLQYPLTLKSTKEAGQHYLLIDSYESKNALQSGNQLSSIALYIPPNSLQTSHNANYEGLDNAALLATAGSQAAELFQGGGGIKGIISAVVGSESVRAAGVSTAVRAGINRNPLAGTALGAGLGLAVNNHMALVYRGPNTFRSHTFNFSFFPKNVPESEMVRDILKDFRKGMLPRYSGAAKTNGRLTSPFFKMPRHYRMSVMSLSGTNPYLDDEMFPRNGKQERINHVITNMTTNHDPNGIVSLHQNGAPVQVNMSLTFQETEFIISEDTVDENFETTSRNLVKQIQSDITRERAERDRLEGLAKGFHLSGEARDKR